MKNEMYGPKKPLKSIKKAVKKAVPAVKKTPMGKPKK